MSAVPPLATRMSLLTAGVAFVLGGAAVGLGIANGPCVAWGFGFACLLQVAPSLALWNRIREGLGNRGLDGERRALRITSHLVRLLALGLAIACVLTWTAGDVPKPTPSEFALAGATLLIWLGLWLGKRRLGDLHPSLAFDATRSLSLAAFAGLWLAGEVAGLWFPWAGTAAGLALAAWLFLEGQTMAKATTVSLVGCGSCGCG